MCFLFTSSSLAGGRWKSEIEREMPHSSFLFPLFSSLFIFSSSKKTDNRKPLGPLGRRHGPPRPHPRLRLLRRRPPPLLPPVRQGVSSDPGRRPADGGSGFPREHHRRRCRHRLRRGRRRELRPHEAVRRRRVGPVFTRRGVAGPEEGPRRGVRGDRGRVGQRAAADADAPRVGPLLFEFEKEGQEEGEGRGGRFRAFFLFRGRCCRSRFFSFSSCCRGCRCCCCC